MLQVFQPFSPSLLAIFQLITTCYGYFPQIKWVLFQRNILFFTLHLLTAQSRKMPTQQNESRNSLKFRFSRFDKELHNTKYKREKITSHLEATPFEPLLRKLQLLRNVVFPYNYISFQEVQGNYLLGSC